MVYLKPFRAPNRNSFSEITFLKSQFDFPKMWEVWLLGKASYFRSSITRTRNWENEKLVCLFTVTKESKSRSFRILIQLSHGTNHFRVSKLYLTRTKETTFWPVKILVHFVWETNVLGTIEVLSTWIRGLLFIMSESWLEWTKEPSFWWFPDSESWFMRYVDQRTNFFVVRTLVYSSWNQDGRDLIQVYICTSY